MEKHCILYVDDEEINLRVFRSLFFSDYEVLTAQTAEETISFLESKPVKVIITDQRMPTISGIDLLKKIIPRFPDPIRIVLTGYTDVNDLMKAVNECGIFRYVSKPWNSVEMQQILQQSIEMFELRRDNKAMIDELKNINETLEVKIAIRTKELEAQKEEMERQRQSLEIANKELVSLNEEKNHLVEVVAHDLRSPLNQIKGMASIIKLTSPDMAGEQAHCVDQIIRSAERLRNMISRILDVNAIEAKEINLKPVKTDIVGLLNDLVNQFKVSASHKSIEIIPEFPLSMFRTRIDRNYLVQVLENLLSNAIKFSPTHKSIHIILDIGSDAVKFNIKIADEGPGLSEEDQKKLFGKFQRLSARPTGGEESTGLGLSIAKRYVEAMGGSIWCESELGKGATFIVEFEHFD